HDPNLHKLWALAHRYQGVSSRLAGDFQYDADSEEQEAELEQKALYYSALEDIVRNIFWVAAKNDIGVEAWRAHGVGLRDGWVLVTTSDNSRVLDAILGGIAL